MVALPMLRPRRAGFAGSKLGEGVLCTCVRLERLFPLGVLGTVVSWPPTTFVEKNLKFAHLDLCKLVGA